MVALTACHSNDAPDSFEPQLFADGAVGVTRNEAELQGSVVLQGNTDVPSLYFRYGTTDAMEQMTAKLTPTDGKVKAQIGGLTAGTGYRYCLESDNGRVVLRSNVMTFTTIPNERPTVSALTPSSRGPVSIVVRYEITDDGGEEITGTGCEITETENGETRTIHAKEDDLSVGTVSILVSGLRQNTSYSLRAFATNKVGTATSDELDITTQNAVTLYEAGELAMLMGDDIFGYTDLSFVGPMNGDDLLCLRRMMGRDGDGTATPGLLADVDMTDANIVSGGGSYGSARYTENNVVGYGLFAGCDRLQRVMLPNSATVIEKDALLGCSSLQQLNIPAAATSVTPSDGCTALSNISVSDANTSYRGIDGVLFNADATRIVWFPIGKSGDYTLPESVTSIGDYAFRGCSVTRFTLPDNLTELGQAVFYNSLIEEIAMPAKLRLVPTGTFQKCSRLTIVRLGAATELISDYVFDGCPLKHIYIDAQYPPVCNADAFSTTDGYDLKANCTLHVPASHMAQYKADRNWGGFANIVGE